MAERSDVVDRADALMRRRNSFVSAPGKRATGEDDDLPVLTEVVPPEGAAAGNEVVATPAVAKAAAPGEFAVPGFAIPAEATSTIDAAASAIAQEHGAGLDDEQFALLASGIADAIAQHMKFELPTLIEAALANASEELRAGITSTINDAVHEFIAQHKRAQKK